MENKQVISKRICIDARFYRRATAGVGRYTRALIHELIQLDTTNNYTVILTAADHVEWIADTKAYPSLENWEVKVLDIPIYSVGEQTKLLSYLNEQKFDLVHFAMFNHPIRYHGRFVVTIHDLIMTFFPLRPLWHPRTWAYRYVVWHAAKKATHVIVPSQSSKKDVHTHLGIPNNKITITYEGVESDFKPVNDEKKFTDLRKKYGLTKPFLFFLNAWRPHKGLPELADAFLQVKETHDIQLLVGGKPNPSFPNVIQAIDAAKQKTPDIITPGFIPDEDMIALYSMTEAYMLPTHYEGFGIPALEAMSCGCPVIAAKSSSTPEVVGDAGLYFPTGDSKAFAREIETLLTNPELKNKLREKGLAQAKKFSFKKMATETLAVYHHVLSQ